MVQPQYPVYLMRVLFLLLILNVSSFAQDRYYLDFSILSNYFNKIEIDNSEIEWQKYTINNNYARLDITENVVNNTNKSFLISIHSQSVADINNNFGFWIQIYRNNDIIFKQEKLTKTTEIDQKNIFEFLVDK